MNPVKNQWKFYLKKNKILPKKSSISCFLFCDYYQKFILKFYYHEWFDKVTRNNNKLRIPGWFLKSQADNYVKIK